MSEERNGYQFGKDAADHTGAKERCVPRFPAPEGAKAALASDVVNHPPHYTRHPSGVECVEVAEHFNFNIGNVIKYVWRAGRKGCPLDDLRKAHWYLAREIARLEKAQAQEERQA